MQIFCWVLDKLYCQIYNGGVFIMGTYLNTSLYQPDLSFGQSLQTVTVILDQVY